jgi:hypothetical protein
MSVISAKLVVSLQTEPVKIKILRQKRKNLKD